MHRAARHHRLASRIALAALIALAVGHRGAPRLAGAQATPAVRIVDFAFTPATLTVQAGTRVTWTHAGQAPHTVTSDTGAFDSGRLMNGQTFTFTFTSAGSFAYHCEIHPNMQARVVVQAAAPAAQPAPAQAGTGPTGQPAPRSAAPAAQAPVAPRPAALPRTGAPASGDGTGAVWPAALLAVLALGGAVGVRLPRREHRP
jgi:plastocyanin